MGKIKYYLFCVVLLIGCHNVLALDYSSYILLDNTSQTNPTGTYTSGTQILEGFSRTKGSVVIDSTGTPTGRINQANDASSALAGTWHGTNTIFFTKHGNMWRGEIDFGITGRYGRLIIGNVTGATYNKIFWYGDGSSGGLRTYTTALFEGYNVGVSFGTTTGYVYNQSGGTSATTGWVDVSKATKVTVQTGVDLITSGTRTVRVEGLTGTSTRAGKLYHIDYGTITTIDTMVPIQEGITSIRVGWNCTVANADSVYTYIYVELKD